MKKILAIALALILVLSLTACGAKKTTAITVAASPTPHAEILEVAKEVLAKDGYELEITEFVDYVQPNLVVEQGELLANYFQHQPYLDDFNAQNDTHLVTVAAIHYEPLGIYPGKTASLADLKEGAQVAVPNDTTNEARALLLLETNGLIKVDPAAGLAATKNDIIENPLNLEIIEIEAAQLPRSLGSVDVAVINGNYAIDAGLKASDALAVECDTEGFEAKYAATATLKEKLELNMYFDVDCTNGTPEVSVTGAADYLASAITNGTKNILKLTIQNILPQDAKDAVHVTVEADEGTIEVTDSLAGYLVRNASQRDQAVVAALKRYIDAAIALAEQAG